MAASYMTTLSALCLPGLAIMGAEKVNDNVKTTFQTSRAWRPTIDNRADAVMVYGVGGNPSDRHGKRHTFEERVKSWKEKGYTVHFMTGIAWGEYQDYFTGEWDGKPHLDEGQVTQRGDTIWHGHMVPYIVPSENFIKYLNEMHVKRVIEAGVDAIFMEEPEFWACSGYSDAFKKEWKEYYGTEWQPQHTSPEATYLSNKLKYYLYYRALEKVFGFAKEYGRSLGRDIKCYVPTHSLVNYSQWQIVSPEASLATLPCVDGYIAQVWTGTSREPNYYDGKYRERVFETAFLEYGSMESMTAPTGRKMFFLTDPIEDRAKDWDDYKRNYQATFTAQLLYPRVGDYEVMPWPERVYEGLYKVGNGSDERSRIPRFYSTQMQVMINALNKMPVVDREVNGNKGIGILMGNSLMFQRFPQHDGYDDPQLANFYGLALPLVKRGVPVKTVHIENLGVPATLADTDVLVMTYSNMKPLDAEAHRHIADWVKKGGRLLLVGSDRDPFQNVREWWTTGGNSYTAASQHLFEQLGLDRNAGEGSYKVGKGEVRVMRNDPKEHILTEGGDKDYMGNIADLYGKKKGMELKNNFLLHRGHYVVAAVMDESVSDAPLTMKGRYIDLFDPELPIVKDVTLNPGTQALLIDLGKVEEKKTPKVLAASFRESDEKETPQSYSFTAKSPVDTDGIARVVLPKRPKSVKIDGVESLECSRWNPESKTYLIVFDNKPEGRNVSITY
ncbi:MAG: DUF4350 domain-containing protein [Muribaculaceae bacterium]|nr:DUF4350 domain-containing protein [Muribaculaceae bacterium]